MYGGWFGFSGPRSSTIQLTVKPLRVVVEFNRVLRSTYLSEIATPRHLMGCEYVMYTCKYK